METQGDSKAILRLEGISKAFGATRALVDVDLELFTGEVLGLVGENGAGKSTLIKILSGVTGPDEGSVLWRQRPVQFRSPHEALAAGVATIHQELAGFDYLTVAENLLLGGAWPRHRWGGVDWRRLYSTAQQRFEDLDIPLDPEQFYGRLSAAEKQELAIARALMKNARLLILDEPTASLSELEVRRIFSRLRDLKKSGVAMIYISHRLDEIMALSDRIAVLRDGRMVAIHRTKDAAVQAVVRDMVGRPLEQFFPHTRPAHTGEKALELRQVTREDMFEDISFSVHQGEIVGLAGLVGAGRSELARAIFGLYPVDDGDMFLFGAPWRPATPRQALDAGLIYLPEERKRHGFCLDHSVAESISVGFSDLMTRRGLVDRRKEDRAVRAAIETYGVRTRSTKQPIGALSGGNQQKALLARWLTRAPKVLALDEPTRGVDVGAKLEIHQLIDRLAGEGKAVLMISSDLTEITGMCDRVLVMCHGRLVAELQGESLTQENIILAASDLADRPHSAATSPEKT